MNSDPIQLDPVRATTLLWRAMRRRCPNCGSGGLFRRWIYMRESCPNCHLRLDRGEADYFIGGFVVNFVAAELLIVAAAFGAIVLTWPEVPWNGILYGLLLTMVPVPILFYPYAKTLWLGIDLMMRPATLEDFEGHGENLPGDDRPESG